MNLRVGVTRSKEKDEVVGRVSPAHVESEETTVLATRAAVDALEWHPVVIEDGSVASQKIRYIVGAHRRRREAERVHVKHRVRGGLNIDGKPV